MSIRQRKQKKPRPPTDPAIIRRRIRTGAWIVVLSAAGYGLHRLEPIAIPATDGPREIDWVDAPAWLDSPDWRFVRSDELEPDIRAEIAKSQNSPEAAGKVVSTSAWIAGVDRIADRADGNLRIYADFRTPWAVVGREGKGWLVDQTGIRLPFDRPIDKFQAAGAGRFLVIRGAKSAPPVAGQPWLGADLAAGLRLAEVLYAARERLGPVWDQIRAIDVSNFANTSPDPYAAPLRLVTNKGTFVDWGVSPGEEYDTEPTAEQKIEFLMAANRNEGGISAGVLDLRKPDGYYIRTQAG